MSEQPGSGASGREAEVDTHSPEGEPLANSSSFVGSARRLSAIRDALGDGALRLAYHAAVPVVVDADLLNLLRVNFFLDDPPEILPFEVEAELLLSPLFREIGEGLYEIDPDLRNLLLSGLHTRYSGERVRRVAALLEQYTNAAAVWRSLPELELAQRLTALSFLDPAGAERWLDMHEASAARPSSSPASSADDGPSREWYVAMRRRVAENSDITTIDTEIRHAGEALLQLLSYGDLSARLSVIRSLESLASLPDTDADEVVTVLCMFIRKWDERSPGLSKRVTQDVQAALSLIGSMPHIEFRLEGVTLTGANLADLDFSYAILNHVTLTELDARGLDLTYAQFSDVILSDANLDGAFLNDAFLEFHTLRQVSLEGVSCEGAYIAADTIQGVSGSRTDGTPLEIRSLSAEPRDASAQADDVTVKVSESRGGVVVMTTLDSEFRAMRDRLDSWSQDWHQAGTYFVRGQMNGVPWPVILMITGPGSPGSSALSERAIHAFEPRALLVVGVAGSLRDDVKLGDVVVADWIYSYRVGKQDEDGFHARPRGGPADSRLQQVARAVSLTESWWEPVTGGVRPRVHFKPIASEDVLLNSPADSLAGQLDRGGLREWLRRHFNDAIAIEMESAGVIRAAQLNDGLPFLAIHGISDRADGTKHPDADQEFQPMAAAHAAAFAAAFLRKLAESEAAREQGRQAEPPPPGRSQQSRAPSASRTDPSRDRTSVPGLGQLLFSTRIDHPAGPLTVGFGAGDTLLVVEKNAAVHRWSLKDGKSGLTGMPSGEALHSGINVVASSAIPAIAIARDRKLVLVHFGQDQHTTSELPLRPDEFLITAAGERFATYDGRRVAVRDFGDGSVLWEQPCPANLATATIDQTGTAIAMAAGPGMLSRSNTVTVVTQDDAAPREFSFENLPLGAGCVLGLSPEGALVACALFREVILASPADRQILRRRRLSGWTEVVPALGARPQRLICTPRGTVLWLRGRRIALVRWDAPEFHYLLSLDGDCDDIAYDPAGSRLAIVSQSGQVGVWEWRDDT